MEAPLINIIGGVAIYGGDEESTVFTNNGAMKVDVLNLLSGVKVINNNSLVIDGELNIEGPSNEFINKGECLLQIIQSAGLQIWIPLLLSSCCKAATAPKLYSAAA